MTKPSSSHSSFDFIEAANYGYKALWENRIVLLRLLSLPFFVKCGCIAAILLMGFQDDVLKHGLLMLPSYFAEGFVIGYVIRMFYANRDIGDDVSQGKLYSNDIMAAMILYVLIKILIAVMLGAAFQSVTPEMLKDSESLPPELASIFLMLFAFTIWAFRFLWMYVPVAMGYSLRLFFKRIASFMITFQMLGTWFICFMPIALFTLLLSQFIASLLGSLGAVELLSLLVISCVQGGMEIIISLLAALSMSHGFKALMSNQ